MADLIGRIQKEFKRIGCPLTVEAVEGNPDLCNITGSQVQAVGVYDAHRAHSALENLQTPDIGDDGCKMVEVALRQIGFATH
jgi:hypothetical protein